MNGLLLVSRAADFAARCHAGQRRKGRAAEPYLNHVAEVAAILAEATEGSDPVLVAAGWLHDVVEDTEMEREDIERLFGTEVASVVAEVTDDKSLAKADRKRRQVETAPTKSMRARLLKLADKTSNVRSLVASPPDEWERERLLDYVSWSVEVAAGCRGLNGALERVFDEAVERARATL